VIHSKKFGGDDDPIEALVAIRKWVKETEANNDASDTASMEVLMCPSCGHVRSVFETKDGEVECVKCGTTFFPTC
jgi:ribosomal protein S27E